MSINSGITLRDRILSINLDGDQSSIDSTGLRSLIIENFVLSDFSLKDSLKFDSMTEYYNHITYNVGPSKMMSYITELTGVSRDEIMSENRKYEFARARKLFMILAAKIYGYGNYDLIGKYIGMNHSSVIYSMKTIGSDYTPNHRGTKLIIDKLCEDWSIDVSVFISYVPGGDVWLKRRRLQLLPSN